MKKVKREISFKSNQKQKLTLQKQIKIVGY